MKLKMLVMLISLLFFLLEVIPFISKGCFPVLTWFLDYLFVITTVAVGWNAARRLTSFRTYFTLTVVWAFFMSIISRIVCIPAVLFYFKIPLQYLQYPPTFDVPYIAFFLSSGIISVFAGYEERIPIAAPSPPLAPPPEAVTPPYTPPAGKPSEEISRTKPVVKPMATVQKEPIVKPLVPKLSTADLDLLVYDYIVQHRGVISVSQAAKDLGISTKKLKASTKRLQKEGKLVKD